MSTPLEPGTTVVLIEERPFDPSDGGPWPAGTQFTIGTFVDAGSSPDGKPYYWGDINAGANNIWAPADSFAVVTNDSVPPATLECQELAATNSEPPANADVLSESSDATYSPDVITAHLVFLDRAHKMTSSDHLSKETTYSKSAGMIRQLLASSEPTQQPAAHMVGNNSDDKENS